MIIFLFLKDPCFHFLWKNLFCGKTTTGASKIMSNLHISDFPIVMKSLFAYCQLALRWILLSLLLLLVLGRSDKLKQFFLISWHFKESFFSELQLEIGGKSSSSNFSCNSWIFFRILSQKFFQTLETRLFLKPKVFVKFFRVFGEIDPEQKLPNWISWNASRNYTTRTEMVKSRSNLLWNTTTGICLAKSIFIF